MSVGVFNAETNETKDVANKSRTAIIDSEMSEESQNPLQNRVITQKKTCQEIPLLRICVRVCGILHRPPLHHSGNIA